MASPREWAPFGTPELNLLIAENAQRRIGELEMPLGSNRSPWIDRALLECGLVQPKLHPDVLSGKRPWKKGRDAPGYPWCAAGVAKWYRDAGAEVPPISASYWRSIGKPHLGPASVDGWLHWAKATGRFSDRPRVGAAVLYGTLKDANHIGVILRLAPILLSVEGNTTFEQFTREGVACDARPVNLPRVIGYAYPEVITVPTQPVSSSPLPRATLRLGSSGVLVQEVQGRLGLKKDGIFGALTEAEVKRFQGQKGLVVDGIVGPNVWKALDSL